METTDDDVKIPAREPADDDKAENVINRIAAEIYGVMLEGRKVDKARNNVASHLLDIARECADRVVFAKASKQAEAHWRSKTRGLKLPKAFIQARSDIKRFFDYELSFYEFTAVEKDGKQEMVKTPRTYSEMGKAYRKKKGEEEKQAANVIEAEKPEGLKQFEAITAFIITAPGMKDEFLGECAVLLRESFETWREDNPAPEKPEAETEEAEAETQEVQTAVNQ